VGCLGSRHKQDSDLGSSRTGRMDGQDWSRWCTDWQARSVRLHTVVMPVWASWRQPLPPLTHPTFHLSGDRQSPTQLPGNKHFDWQAACLALPASFTSTFLKAVDNSREAQTKAQFNRWREMTADGSTPSIRGSSATGSTRRRLRQHLAVLVLFLAPATSAISLSNFQLITSSASTSPRTSSLPAALRFRQY